MSSRTAKVIERDPISKITKTKTKTAPRTPPTYASGHFYLFEAEPVPLVEHEQHQRLEERHLELLLALEEKEVITVFSHTASYRSLLCVRGFGDSGLTDSHRGRRNYVPDHKTLTILMENEMTMGIPLRNSCLALDMAAHACEPAVWCAHCSLHLTSLLRHQDYLLAAVTVFKTMPCYIIPGWPSTFYPPASAS